LDGRLVHGDCYWITLRPGVSRNTIYLLLALANSSLMTRFHDLAFNNKLYSARRRYITQYVAKYPFPDPALPACRKLIALTRRIVQETTRDDQSEDHPLCAEVEALVLKSFGLEPAEEVR
ncbi:MAG: modification methylase, partial [Phycisphaerae bacterium]